MNKPSRKIGLVVIIALVVTVLPGALTSSQDEITIDFWHGLTGPDGSFIEEMVNFVLVGKGCD